jgi:hypothetical protein
VGRRTPRNGSLFLAIGVRTRSSALLSRSRIGRGFARFASLNHELPTHSADCLRLCSVAGGGGVVVGALNLPTFATDFRMEIPQHYQGASRHA